MKNLTFSSVIILLVALGMGITCAYLDCSRSRLEAQAATWQTSTLAGGGSITVGTMCSIAVDSLGNLHASYYDNTNKRLIYAYRSDGTWQTEAVAGSVASPEGNPSSIAVDSNDAPHIAYKDQTNQDIKYATKASGSWVVETVSTQDNSGGSPKIALDSENNPHIAYIYNLVFVYQARYAYKSGGSWSIETVDTGNSFSLTDINVKSGDVPVLGYKKGSDGLYYATREGGSWSSSVVNSNTTISDPSLATNSLDKSHFAYADNSARTDYYVRYASKDNGSWGVEDLATSTDSNFGGYSSIDFSTDDAPRVVYYGDGSTGLWYATEVGGTWAHELVENINGKSSDIGVDSANKNHIASYDNGSSLIKYSTDSVGVSNSSLVIDSGNDYSQDNEVALAFSYSGNPTKMMVGEASDLSDATAEPFSSSLDLDLSSGDGLKTVYFKLGNTHGWTEIGSQQITVDSQMPVTSPSVEGGTYSDPQEVVLTSSQPGATIYYTEDNSTPSGNSTVYTEPIKINCSTTLKYFAVDSAGNSEAVQTQKYTIRKQSIVSVPGAPGSVQIRMFNNLGEEMFHPGFLAYSVLLRGGASVASGDLNGDGQAEIVVAPIDGGSPQVRIFNYLGQEKFIPGFDAYAENIRCGVDVATGDLNGDGRDEIITVPGEGCPAHVRIFNYKGENVFTPGFYAYNKNLRTGFRVAAGDLNGDGRDEIITVPSDDALAYVRTFDFRGDEKFTPGFYAYEGLTTGADVAAGDLNGDGKEEIITVPGSGNPAHVRYFDYLGNMVLTPGFYAYDMNIKTGFHVASGDFDCDGRAEIVTIPRSGASSQVRTFDFQGNAKYTPGFYVYYRWLQAGGDVAVGGIH